MPTFKNDTRHYIDYEALVQYPNGEPKKILVRFEPGEERGFPFWIPYQKLGLTLINADYPVVPNTILISGNFNFDTGTERRFNIEHCDIYIVNVIVQSGKVAMYPGSSNRCVEIAENTEVPYHYKATFDWEYAPYLRFIGLEDDTVVTIHAEIDRDYLVNAKVGGRTWQ